MKAPKRRRSLTARVIASGVLQALAPDVATTVGLALIGVSVYRLSPDLVWGYAGLIVLVPVVAMSRLKTDPPKRATD